MAKELRINAELLNNNLYREIYKNYSSVSEFSRHLDEFRGSKTSEVAIGQLLKLKASPIDKLKKQYRKICLDVEKFLRLPVDYLFPLEIYNIPKTRISKEIDYDDVLRLDYKMSYIQDYDSQIADNDTKNAIHDVIDEILSDREKLIVEHRFGMSGKESLTFEELGYKIGLSSMRVRQIEHKAIRKLREHERKTNRLKNIMSET
jgi:RNA polymerase sigma factor (sigma-70 family)